MGREMRHIVYFIRSQHINYLIAAFVPVPVATRSKAWVCDRTHAGIAGSNPAGAHVCLL